MTHRASDPARRRNGFTGWHMTAILVAFFAVVIVVNVTMARLAISSFGGTVVDNSYVASQKYNLWLNRAAVQDRLGWQQSVTLDGERHIVLTVEKDGARLDGIAASATLIHPLGRAAPRNLHFEAQSDGTLRSREVVGFGRWRLSLTLRRGSDEARYQEDVQ